MFIVKELFSVDAGALSDNPIPTDIYTSNEANKKGKPLKNMRFTFTYFWVVINGRRKSHFDYK